ncbi:hypothetical protein [Bradyrhizobium sp.]|uniref:hypothetical protein n=1 Tax=Bradyrhizobium sp. TaxID=376 RepID=UPI0039E7118E
MNIAEIGFAADTSDLEAATDSLQALVPASAAAESAAAKTSAALSGMSAAASKVAAAAAGVTTQTAAAAKVTQIANGATNAAMGANKAAAAAAGKAAAANDNLAHSHAGLSTQAMAASHSIRSMVEQIAMGMPPTQILMGQLNHLSYAASGPGGLSKAFSDAIGTFSQFITVGRLVVGGIVGIIVAFGSLAVSVTKSLVALDDLSQRSTFTIAQLHALQQAMSLKSVAPEDFETAVNAIAKGVSDASHNMGGLNDLFRANSIRIKDNVSALASVADLVARTGDGQQRINILQAAGLPTTQSFMRFMAQGGAAIKAAAANTVQFNSDAEKNLIAKAREFDDMWNRVTTNFTNYFKLAVVTAVNELSKLSDIQIPSWLKNVGRMGASLIPGLNGILAARDLYNGLKTPNPIDDRFGAFTKPSNSGSLAEGLNASAQKLNGAANGSQPKTHNQVMKEISDAQARISILGDLATVEQQVQQKQLELNAANLNGIGVNDTMAAKIRLAAQAQAEQNRVNQMAQAGIFNLSDAQKAAADTLQHWIDMKIVDPTNTQQMAAAHQVLARSIDQTREAAAIAAAPLQQLKQLELDSGNVMKQFDQTATTALNNLVQPIQDVLNGTTKIKDGFKNMAVVVLQAIQQMIIKMLILKPIAAGLQGLFGFSNGGVPGAVGPTSLGGAPLVANALGGVYNSPSLSAYSGMVVSNPTLFRFASGMGLMGEAGPEGILPLKRGPSGQLGVQMFGSTSANNDNSSVQITYAPTYGDIAPGADPKAIAELRAAQAKDRAEFGSNVAKTMQSLRKHNVRV